MRNGFPTAVVAMTLAGLFAPAAAEAHHVAGGSAECTLVGNVPTITAQASFVGFAWYNKPVAGQMDVDGKTVATISGFTFSGASGTWSSTPVTATPGSHHIGGEFWWPHQDGMNGGFSADVDCPAPLTPTPTPTPTPNRTPTATPPAKPPVTPPPSGSVGRAPVKAPRCVPRKLGHYRITVTPKGAMHGLVTFHLTGRQIARNVRWFVDTRAAGKSGKSWEWVHDHGRAYSVYLWAQKRWGVHLWGRHTIEARFKVTNSCGTMRSVRVERLYFNHDPRPDDPIFAH